MVLAEHRALVERATTEHGGVVVEHEGDSMLTVFGSADHAFRAADAIHTHLAGRWPGATGPSVRIGIHTDHAAPVGDRYVTLAVHQVARIATCGHGGQTLVSDATRRELSGSLPTADLGLFWLRDFDEPARLHQACTMNETADSFPDLRAAPFLEPGFETEVTSFIGRAEQVELLVELLGQHRLVSVVGLGGAGKSRLAREVARHLSRPDGVRLVELASVRSLASLPAVVASAVGLRLDDDRPHRDLLIQHLRATSMVLVLDNCEHLERAVGALAQAIVGACPAVGLLCTSRTAIGVAGERVWRIPPLARDEGVDLFCDRADALSGLGSSLHEPEQRSAIGRLCDDLDGLPLAIELAAGCTETMTVAEIASRLNDRFRLLVSSSDSSPERHRTLRAMLESSTDLLSDPARTALRRFGVVGVGFDLPMAEVAATLGDADPLDVEAALRELARHSVVSVERRGDSTWFRLHETVRLFALDELERARERVSAYAAVADWLASEHDVHKPPDIGWVRSTGLHLPVLRSVGDVLVHSDADRCARLALVASRYFWTRSDEGAGIEMLLSWAAQLTDSRPPQRDLAAHLTFALLNLKRVAEAEEWLARYAALVAATGSDCARRPLALEQGYLSLVRDDTADARARFASIDVDGLDREARMMYHWILGLAELSGGDTARSAKRFQLALDLAFELELGAAVIVLANNLAEVDAPRLGWSRHAPLLLDCLEAAIELERPWDQLSDQILKIAWIAYESGDESAARQLLHAAHVETPAVPTFFSVGPDIAVELREAVGDHQPVDARGHDRWDTVRVARRVLRSAIDAGHGAPGATEPCSDDQSPAEQ